MKTFGVLSHLEPKKVFEYFEILTQIPHGSYNCKAVSDYCVDFARQRGLFVSQDDHYNVIIKKEASPSCAHKPALILQGHLDMVCQKEPDSPVDFTKDGLELEIDGDFVCAKGTTLGGDDGIAVAYCLALLDDDSVKHPPLEIVFTTEEEVGMEGASALDMSVLEGRYLLNIDSEEEGILLTGCAGGTTVKVSLPLRYEQRQGNICKVSITGLLGGHSGTEIDKNRGNAHILMGQLLNSMKGIRLVRICGAQEQKDNAIPNRCYAELVCEDRASAEEAAARLLMDCKKQFQNTDDGIEVALEFLAPETKDCFTPDVQDAVLYFLTHTPNGIYTMSRDVEGLVESSLNLGILKTESQEISFSFGVRSSAPAYKEELAGKLKSLADQLNGSYERTNDYPAWEYKKDSVLRDLFLEKYRQMYGKEMKVEMIHAGLECGIFASKIEGLDIVAFGPDIFDIHTTYERLSISSVKRTWELLLKIIEEFP
ncbi:aminoacyl-histidine dipeptidase [Anaerostipes sp.]|uniref:aminoacyl-histidine dipeptidase n=1 Tax=Anaerostipes sp. TaxID=1872530 RepID=UPI0025B837C9|nr:aminoacyl-histidine dipeptidase [Anaerostipes sp.]MBS7009461.1 aminoacyl-histidine dipeptidase [Anaerostipes sp.]